MAETLETRNSAGDRTNGSRRFYAHARDEGRHHDHLVPDAADAQDAALIFAEHWAGAEDSHEVHVIVRDGATGERQCFTIDLDAGAAAPCD